MRPTVDILEDFFNSLTYSSTVSNIIDNSDGTFTFNTCKTFHARVKSIVTIGGNDYTVTAFNNNVNITVTAAPAPVGVTYTIAHPFYFHDTPTSHNITLANTDKSAKYPMIWVREVIKDTFDNDISSTIERNSNLRLYFLDNSNLEDWNTDEHYAEITNPMLNLFEEFKIHVNNYKFFGRPDDFEVTYHNRFGQYEDKKGHVKQFFNDNLSGIEIIFALPIKNTLLCTHNNCT